MKLLRYGPKGWEKPGMLDHAGQLRDLSSIVPDITPAVLAPAQLARLRLLDPASLPLVADPGRIAPPLAGIGKFICVGLNYADHAEEAGLPAPAEPILFLKPGSAVIGSTDPVVLPRGSRKADWEAELGVVIGSTARYVSEDGALAHVAGYCVCNDISEREYQLERGGGQWDKGKGCDTFGPIGPWLVTRDEVGDPQHLDIWLEVNGRRFQNGNTRTMIFGVASLLSYISRFMTLYPGDIVSTGTPPGVGMGQKPPVYLAPGDRIRLGITGLGQQQLDVHAWDAALIDG